MFEYCKIFFCLVFSFLYHGLLAGKVKLLNNNTIKQRSNGVVVCLSA